MRVMMTVLAALGLMAFADPPLPGTEPPAAGNPAAEERVTPPAWKARPDAETIAGLYPEKAARLEMEGRATILCKVALDERLRDCQVVSESPEGYGFGEATLKMAEHFRMTPGTRDGKPVEGGTVRIPVNYALPDDPLGKPAGLPPLNISTPQLLLGLGGLAALALLAVAVIIGWDLRRRPTDP